MICIIFTIFFLAKILIIISFTFPFRPRLQLLNYLVKLALHLDSFEIVWKIDNYPEKAGQF